MQNTTRIDNGIDAGRLDQDTVIEGASQVGMGVIVTLSVLTGIWGLACLISAISQDGNLMGILKSWLTAVTGM